jgi:hypothetical protein
MHQRASVLAIAIALACTSSAGAQAPTFRSGTTLIQVDAIVKDSAGRFVAGLTAEDFELREEGSVRAIDAFYLLGYDASRHPAGGLALDLRARSRPQHKVKTRSGYRRPGGQG